MRAYLVMVAALSVVAVACGGTTVVDGGTGGASATNSSSSGSTQSSSSGTINCSSHADCPPNALCNFGTGQCALACTTDACETCPGGQICDGCGTSSCPQCADCAAICVAAPAGECDDHDDCAGDEQCVYSTRRCAPKCDATGCADPNLVCTDCATASCPCCEDCQAVCLPL